MYVRNKVAVTIIPDMYLGMEMLEHMEMLSNF